MTKNVKKRGFDVTQEQQEHETFVENDKEHVQDTQETLEHAEEQEKTEQELEIERLSAENDALADKALRAQAELQNIQKRQAKERQDLLKYRSQSLANTLLPVLDSLEQALTVEVSDEQGIALKKGIEMAYTNFVSALASEGIEKIESLNQPFDPTVHQAIQQIPAQDGQEADYVVQVFQDGYKLHDRVIRPAMVVISQ
ncbi:MULTISPECIES: nucleotide exchange factor GrpE [unclassified Granulicatella]|uniref:nucleotide exchange factor GrpE n=1 Tax=unclassified Granulicatella TaxID=2630493 RepID=UPI0010739DE2|nr:MULTISPECIES: nucleotide exchange factor GrpE [unclassified Granulicatella]MBF0779876.1 nucleotide exchange factor GrpE [Granulicatella sp. 19428wC4_WM01]TFU96080.1 nucleotide exchange factor GrpE [Granulicatella sp. WM01]